MLGNELRGALRSGKRVYGTCVCSNNARWAAVVRGLGLDLVFLDTEHIPQDRGELAWMCQTYAAMGIAPVVRVPEPDPYQACIVLDGGAQGVIAPYVETVEEVKRLAGAVKHRPLKGARLRRALDGEETLEPVLTEYLANWNKNNVLIINIESQTAIDALEDLLAVEEVDSILIGPHDLSLNLGVPEQYDHPKFDAAVREIFTKARAAGKGAGVHFSDGLEQEVVWARDTGANLIMHSSDLAMFRGAMDSDIVRMKEMLGDAVSESGEDESTV
ncbi:MAG: aldolase/citrate lyase family protein [Planctomycetota bacterium]|jgi:4-hydroxy-2-oxoheptanedioate aldolase|nr:aldolase/citrate lyase family protein [Planctomycetota bacterium]